MDDIKIKNHMPEITHRAGLWNTMVNSSHNRGWFEHETEGEGGS